ncbi:MAG: ABC transporter substrate-binding protein [Granulosicoccus sp.]
MYTFLRLRKRVLLIALAFAALSANADTKIGAPFALSGSVAALAADMKAGAALAAAHVNAQGGVLGERYELLYKDSACEPGRAVEVVRSLIEEDGVSALVGPVCSGATLRQAQSVSIPAGVVTLSMASASHHITNLRDRDLVFRTALSDSYKGEAMAAYVFKQGVSSLSVSFASDAYNTSLAKVFTQAYEKLGGKVVINQAHQPEKSDYKREVDALAGGSNNVALFAY